MTARKRLAGGKEKDVVLIQRHSQTLEFGVASPKIKRKGAFPAPPGPYARHMLLPSCLTLTAVRVKTSTFVYA
jgi:hypothetical protein